MTPLKTIVAMLAFAAFANSQSGLDSRVGLVDSMQGNKACLSIQNDRISEGAQISLVFPQKPQRVRTATVEKKVSAPCSEKMGGDGETYYTLKLQQKLDPFVAFGLTGVRSVSATGGAATADVNGDGRKESFRQCASREGLHLTVWSGKPLVSKRLWHRYYYLGYDVDPSCKQKDSP